MPLARAWREDRVVRGVKFKVVDELQEGRSSPRSITAAIEAVARALSGRKVTFRETVDVQEGPPPGYQDLVSDLPETRVEAGARGRTVTVMVDGRDLVELDDGRSVLAFVGHDCVLLGWWHRLVDWAMGRRFRRRQQ